MSFVVFRLITDANKSTLSARSQHANSTELTCNKSTQLHDAFIDHERRRHDLIGCSETRTVGVQPIREQSRWKACV